MTIWLFTLLFCTICCMLLQYVLERSTVFSSSPSSVDFRHHVGECSVYYAVCNLFSLLLSLLGQLAIFTVLISVSFRVSINQLLQSVVSTQHRILLKEAVLTFLVYLRYHLIINLNDTLSVGNFLEKNHRRRRL